MKKYLHIVKLAVLCAFAIIIIITSCTSCMFFKHPESTNVFEEIYNDFNTDYKMINGSKSFILNLEWSDFGDVWRDSDSAVLGFRPPNSQNNTTASNKNQTLYYMYLTRNDATILFVKEIDKDKYSLFYSFRYSLETKELTYATNDYESDVQSDFLFNLILDRWYKETDSKFSPQNWGNYRLVLPRTESCD